MPRRNFESLNLREDTGVGQSPWKAPSSSSPSKVDSPISRETTSIKKPGHVAQNCLETLEPGVATVLK